MDTGTALSLAFIIIGIFMLLAEAATPGSFIIVPATVLIILGVLGLINADWLLSWWAPIIALVVLIPMTYAATKLYQMLAPPAPPETTVASSLVGKTGYVTVEVVPGSIIGKVRISNDIWSATAATRIPAGTPVRVVSSQGVHVVVEETVAQK